MSARAARVNLPVGRTWLATRSVRAPLETDSRLDFFVLDAAELPKELVRANRPAFEAADVAAREDESVEGPGRQRINGPSKSIGSSRPTCSIRRRTFSSSG